MLMLMQGSDRGGSLDSGLVCFGEDVPGEAVLEDQRGVGRGTQCIVDIEGSGGCLSSWSQMEISSHGAPAGSVENTEKIDSPGTRPTSLEDGGRLPRRRCPTTATVPTGSGFDKHVQSSGHFGQMEGLFCPAKRQSGGTPNVDAPCTRSEDFCCVDYFW